MLELLFPYLLLLFCLVSFFFIYKRWWKLLIVLSVGIVCLNFYGHVYPMRLPVFIRNYSLEESVNIRTIRVMSFNINGSKTDFDNLSHLCSLIINNDADVVFLTETPFSGKSYIDSLLLATYPYHSFLHDSNYRGNCFYSKYPLSKMVRVTIESSKYSYCFNCKTAVGKDTLSIFGVHLASNNYTECKASIRPENIDDVFSFFDYLNNIQTARKKRCEETLSLVACNNGYSYSIIMGDFNDVCGAEPLNILEGSGFKDAWWVGGFGYGATIHHPLPYRIDHIMYGEGLELIEIKKVDSKELSDHDALLAKFIIKV